MVDPNRKINILTKEQDQFLEECEEEFKNRFTEDDEEFMEYCKKPSAKIPIVDQWMVRRNFNHHHNRNDHNHRGNYNNYRGRHNNSGRDYGGRGGGNNYHRHGGGGGYHQAGGGSGGGGGAGAYHQAGGGSGGGGNRFGNQQDYKRQAFNYNQNQ